MITLHGRHDVEVALGLAERACDLTRSDPYLFGSLVEPPRRYGKPDHPRRLLRLAEPEAQRGT